MRSHIEIFLKFSKNLLTIYEKDMELFVNAILWRNQEKFFLRPSKIFCKNPFEIFMKIYKIFLKIFRRKSFFGKIFSSKNLHKIFRNSTKIFRRMRSREDLLWWSSRDLILWKISKKTWVMGEECGDKMLNSSIYHHHYCTFTVYISHGQVIYLKNLKSTNVVIRFMFFNTIVEFAKFLPSTMI